MQAYRSSAVSSCKHIAIENQRLTALFYQCVWVKVTLAQSLSSSADLLGLCPVLERSSAWSLVRGYPWRTQPRVAQSNWVSLLDNTCITMSSGTVEEKAKSAKGFEMNSKLLLSLSHVHTHLWSACVSVSTVTTAHYVIRAFLPISQSVEVSQCYLYQRRLQSSIWHATTSSLYRSYLRLQDRENSLFWL